MTGSQRILDENICVHILAVSAAMLGVCVTVIGLVRIVIAIRAQDTIIDDMLSIAALLFLIASFASYWVLRTKNISCRNILENIADTSFLIGLVCMTISCLLITYWVTVM